MREAPDALLQHFAFLLLCTSDRGKVYVHQSDDETTDEDDEHEEGDVERAKGDVQTTLTSEDHRRYEHRSDRSHRRVSRTCDRLTRDPCRTLHVTSDDVGIEHCLKEGHSRACDEAC